MKFFKEFKNEMMKMKWAKKGEVVEGAFAVVAISLIILIYFFVADMGIMAIKNIWNGIF